MPLKDVHPSYDFITFSDKDFDLIDASFSILLPLEEDEELNYQNCIVVYFDYDFSNPYSERIYKLFKFYTQTTRKIIESDFTNLGKIQGLYILSDIKEKDSVIIIDKLSKRHIAI